MTAAQQRRAQRFVHLAAALVLIAYLYAPLDAQLENAVRFLVLPVLVMTGIAMWQAPRIRRLRKRVGRTSALVEPRIRRLRKRVGRTPALVEPRTQR